MNKDKIARLILFDDDVVDTSTGFNSITSSENYTLCDEIMDGLKTFLEDTHDISDVRYVRQQNGYVLYLTSDTMVKEGYEGNFSLTFPFEDSNPESRYKALLDVIRRLGEGRYTNGIVMRVRGLKYLGDDERFTLIYSGNLLDNVMFHICSLVDYFYITHKKKYEE